jgi:enoyl-CoA hydratase/carnithine racemase
MSCSLTLRDGVSVLTLASPILSTQLLRGLETEVSRACGQDPARPLVLASAHPRIFLAGAHLAEIERLRASTSVAYAGRGRRVISTIDRFPAPTVAAVHGPCAGGGVDLILACDSVIAGPRATFSHPGVRRGLLTGWGGTTVIPARLEPCAARRTFLEGHAWTAHEAVALGLARAVAADPVAAARAEASRLAGLDPSRLNVWRSLRRRSFVDTFSTFVVHHRR